MVLELVWSFSASLKNSRTWFDSKKHHQYSLSQVGKAADFDSAMRWFESIRECQFLCPCSLMVKKRAYTSSKHGLDKPECRGSSPLRGTKRFALVAKLVDALLSKGRRKNT